MSDFERRYLNPDRALFSLWFLGKQHAAAGLAFTRLRGGGLTLDGLNVSERSPAFSGDEWVDAAGRHVAVSSDDRKPHM